MAYIKGSSRNPKGEYNTTWKGSAKKPPIGNYNSQYEREISESEPEKGLGKRVAEG